MQELLGRLRGGAGGDPDARAERKTGQRGAERLDRGDETFGGCECGGPAGAGHDREELVSTEPGHVDPGGRGRGDPARDGTEDSVARLVAEGVVDLLEPVEIDE